MDVTMDIRIDRGGSEANSDVGGYIEAKLAFGYDNRRFGDPVWTEENQLYENLGSTLFAQYVGTPILTKPGDVVVRQVKQRYSVPPGRYFLAVGGVSFRVGTDRASGCPSVASASGVITMTAVPSRD